MIVIDGQFLIKIIKFLIKDNYLKLSVILIV